MGKINKEQFQPERAHNFDEGKCWCVQGDVLVSFGAGYQHGRTIADMKPQFVLAPEEQARIDEYLLKIKIVKEKDQMSTVQNDQVQIDAEVRELLAKPRRDAEVARRKVQAEALFSAAGEGSDVEDTFEVGTVLRWKRDDDGVVNTYIAIKMAQNWWNRSGGVKINGTSYAIAYVWESLVEHLVSGKTTATDLQVVKEWSNIF